MTVIEEHITLNDGRTRTFRSAPSRRTTPKPKPVPPPKPTVPALVRRARHAAVVITVGIGAASFLLSFAGLTDLALRSGIPAYLSWLWPLTVDGTIIQATVAIAALAAYPNQSHHRRFFWWVLIGAATVSVSGNILHALITGPISPLLAALVVTVAPLSLLATTHGLAILVRFDPENPISPNYGPNPPGHGA